MAREFELDTSRVASLIELAPLTAHRAAKESLTDALDDWVVQAVDIAPIDKGTLRRGIKSEGVKDQNGELVGEVSSTAIERDFNYAYYIHELDAGGKNVGGVHQYLDKSAEENQAKWEQQLADDIESALRGAGW